MAMANKLRSPFVLIKYLLQAFPFSQSERLQVLADVVTRTWHLGFTAFGGPPVHFQIYHRKFVDGQGKSPWIDEKTYQEVFALCQALPGPTSTKMIFQITLIHAGFLASVLVFFIWSLPTALCMYALSLGIGQVNEVLPEPVYALLSGLNASTVGVIALAAVQLAGKAISDHTTRALVVFGACAGICYGALWYFPLLIVIGAISTWTRDAGWYQWVADVGEKICKGRFSSSRKVEDNERQTSLKLELAHAQATNESSLQSPSLSGNEIHYDTLNGCKAAQVTSTFSRDVVPVKIAATIMAAFLVMIVSVQVMRSQLHKPPLQLEVFANMLLAGTIIFGGGNVVVPLLRDYVVAPGWVTSRDFLFGLAIVQALPGPSFNFAVYLGALAVASTGAVSFIGAVLAFLGIFTPGLVLSVCLQSVWARMRSNQAVISILRGINATAVGLVFSAIYRLWQIGYVTAGDATGKSLANEPWWLVVTTLTYAATAWFRVPVVIAMLGGAVLGLCWYAVVGMS